MGKAKLACVLGVALITELLFGGLFAATPAFAKPLPPATKGHSLPAGQYSLDTLPRTTSARGKLQCPQLPMVRHKGDALRYHKPVYIYRDFKPHLVRFEKLVKQVAKEIYGRAPIKIRHLGTYNCRRIRKYPELLSEHAVGNAIDIASFIFARGKTSSERKAAPHKRLRRSFEVSILDHWHGRSAVNKHHARFLKTLTRRLLEDKVFRVLLGPAYPGHQNHFHFDMAPYELVQL